MVQLAVTKNLKSEDFLLQTKLFYHLSESWKYVGFIDVWCFEPAPAVATAAQYLRIS